MKIIEIDIETDGFKDVRMSAEEIFKRIEDEIYKGTYDVCIHCKQKSEYHPNPGYQHVCDKCGHKGSQIDVYLSFPRDRCIKILKEVLYE